MRKIWTLFMIVILLIGISPKVSADTLVYPGPPLPFPELGWGNFGLLIRANINVNLVSVRFPNQGKADLIELRRHSDGALLTSVATPAGNPNITVVFNYPLSAGVTYRLLATTMSNRYSGNLASLFPVGNAHISVLSSYGNGNPHTDWWASFNDITTMSSPLTLTVNINPTGGGIVTGTGINCPGDCTETVNYNTNILLTATPATGYAFVSWIGCDAPSGNTCTMTMTADKTATANFTNSPKKKVISPSILPIAQNNILKAKDLLVQAEGLLTQAKAKNLDTGTCEKIINEANEFMKEANARKASPVTANYYALKAIQKLQQAIDCLKALLG
jgi:hypothetical protein